jgi:hypothetical protein
MFACHVTPPVVKKWKANVSLFIQLLNSFFPLLVVLVEWEWFILTMAVEVHIPNLYDHYQKFLVENTCGMICNCAPESYAAECKHT